MGDVATRAGVAKTTLYRRWAGKNELVVDAVAVLFDELELPDLGSLSADVQGVVLQFAGAAGAPGDQDRADGRRRRVDPRRGAAGPDPRRRSWTGRSGSCCWAGNGRSARGELPVEADEATAATTADLIFDVIAGAVVHRALVSAEPVDEDWARRFTVLLLAGLGAAAAT